MPELTLVTAFVAGLLGSTHCVAMCGGIATALGTTRVAGASAHHALLYQLGRIASYALAGALAGWLGAAAGHALAIPGWAGILRLATALIVIVIGLDIALGALVRARWLRAPERLGAMLWRRIAPVARVVLPAQADARAVAVGLLWGWLPCGLVYSVLLAAAVSGGPASGSATMVAFGLGTLPAMLGLSYAGTRIPRGDGLLARLLGAVIVACGLWTAALPVAELAGLHTHAQHALQSP